EGPQPIGRELVAVALHAFDRRAQGARGDAKPPSLLGAHELLQRARPRVPQLRVPVPLPLVRDVGGDDLGRPAALQLEGEETVVRPYIETTLAGDVGPGHALDDRAQVEPAGRDDPAPEVEGVVPEAGSGDRIAQLAGV